MTQPTSSKTLRITGIVLLCLLLAGGLTALWLRQNYKSIIQKKLPGLARKATDSLYQVAAGDVDIDLINRKVVITDFDLVPDPEHIARLRRDFRLPKMLLRIHIDKVIMDDIAWGEVLRSREIVCGSMEIQHPVVRLRKLADTAADKPGKNQPSTIQAIRAGSISIINPDVLYATDTTAAATSLGGIGGRITLTDWQYDLRKPADTGRLFYASRTSVRLDSFFLQQAAGQYRIGSGAITYDQSGGGFSVTDFIIQPAVSREQFYRRAGHQKEIYALRLPAFSLQELDWRALLQRGELLARSGRLDNAAIDIFMSRLPPLNTKSKNGNFPQQMLMKLGLPIHIPELEVRNGRFSYTEKNEKTRQDGVIAMSAIRGTIRNLTNIPARLKRQANLVVSLAGNFKGAPVAATFNFQTASKSGAFTLSGKLGALDGTRLNDITKPLALAEIQSLRIHDIAFSLSGSEAGAKGRVTMQYSDLKVGLLKMEDGSLDEQGLVSFLANGLFIHDANPAGRKKVRTAAPVYARDETKSFFNLVWKTIFTGMLQTASRKAVPLDKLVNKRAQKQEEKRLEKERAGR